MNAQTLLSHLARLGLITLIFFFGGARLEAQNNSAADPGAFVLTVVQGQVEVAPANVDEWRGAQLNQKLRAGERLRTGPASRARLVASGAKDVLLGPGGFLTIKDPRAAGGPPVVGAVRGFLHIVARGQPTDIDIRDGLATAAARQTEFLLFVAEDGRAEVTVFDGLVDLANAQGSVSITNREAGVAQPGQPPVKSPALETVNLVQWVLSYPGVLNVDELPWDAAAQNDLAASLAAYRRGDLVAAAQAYPPGRAPATDVEKIYRAALLLAAGEVEAANALLDSVALPSEFSVALRKLIAAVKGETFAGNAAPQTASGRVAESYYRQSRRDLNGALAAARAATEAAPEFGFAWARVAELGFSFGRVDAAQSAVEQALALSPRHAGALTLKGFLFSAQNKIRDAIRQFDEAILVDGALAEAWLGRGLCRIRRGDVAGGRDDLRTAVALQPHRAVLRNYLAKSLSDAGRADLAEREFELSRQTDANDPTVWLYGALHRFQQNEVNEAIRELERSQDLNTNRAVYRSAQLLDQDRAVRSANLAALYLAAGMTDVALREAGRAVSDDYGNYSAHLFLANSYERLRDPKQINQRFETPAFAEYLIANLLAPVGAGMLSPAISAQEYSKLFERDRFGVSSRTEYHSDGSWFQEGAQYGTFGNMSYSLEGLYRSDHGQRPNNELEQRQFSAQFKQQFTARDTVFFQALDYRAKTGDVLPHYDQRQGSRDFRNTETQEPTLLAGWHREWSPGQHTLFLGSMVDDTSSSHSRGFSTLSYLREDTGEIGSVFAPPLAQRYESKISLYAAELQQIIELGRHTAVLGARFQAGEFDLESAPQRVSFGPFAYTNRQEFSEDFQRVALYAYDSWRVLDSLRLIGGVTYDHLTYPQNFRAAPLHEGTERRERLSPKAGLVWTPGAATAVRLGYAQALGGASLDQSFQIEPSQVAGFNQSFRSLIPEAVAGANAGARFEMAGLSVEHQFPTRTYFGVALEHLASEVARDVGVFEFRPPPPTVVPAQVRQRIEYDENSLTVSLNQLVGERWAFGARYRVSHADYEAVIGAIPEFRVDPTTGIEVRPDHESVLQQALLYAIYNHPAGWFVQGQAVWTAQHNRGYPDADSSDIIPIEDTDFWQLNVLAGYRFWQRRAEVAVGLLNLTDKDYRLAPLNLTTELPRERTFVARLSFKF